MVIRLAKDYNEPFSEGVEEKILDVYRLNCTPKVGQKTTFGGAVFL